MRSARRLAVYICTHQASRARALAAGLAMIGAVHTPGVLLGQTNWAYTSNTISAPAGTNVGIGGTPLLKLDVIGGSNESNLFRVRSDYTGPQIILQNSLNSGYGGGAVNFQTSQGSFAAPVTEAAGQVLGSTIFSGYDGSNYTLSSMIRGSVDDNVTVSAGIVPGVIRFYTQPTTGGSPPEVMRINSRGYVGIGTTSPQNTLSVNGIIQAKEVLVNTGWSDYVFAPNYRLRPLKEVKAYIAKNHHLPEIPTEADVKKDGVTLGTMEAKLLAKVEELTLHMIQADEQNNRLEQQNRQLQERVARLEAGAQSRSGAKRGN
jgi:hypothetical protein